MNKKAKDKTMELYKSPTVTTKDGQQLSFARVTDDDVKRIEAMTNEELIEKFNGINRFLASPGAYFGSSDFHWRDLLNLEIYERRINDLTNNKL